MKVYRPKPDLLILEHGSWRRFLLMFAVLATTTIWAFAKSPVVGLITALVGFWIAGRARRFFEHVRVAFDRTAGSAEIRRRSLRNGNSGASYDLDEIGHVEVKTKRGGNTRPYRLLLVIPDGAHAGRHPINKLLVDERRVPEYAGTINQWLTQTS